MSLQTQEIHLDKDGLNIISNKNDEKILDNLIDQVGAFPRDFEANFNSKILRLSREKIKIASQVAGCKLTLAKNIADTIFDRFHQAINLDQQNPSHHKLLMYTTKQKFLQILREEFKKNNLQKERSILDFELALDIIEQTKSIIILLGGTSGSGKSTVGSLLASRFGIPTVLSTDSIRHVMRNFMTNEECPVLFCSTYEAGKKIQLDQEVKESKRITMGFQQQAAAVQQRLTGILEGFHKRGESIVVEGVHLTPDFMIEMVKKFNNCVPFLIYISNENKHRERFAVRSKYMTLEKRLNKYVENFSSIRCIQKYLTKKAEEYLIPKVDNSNVDKSVGIVHRTMVRCLRRISIGESLYDFENNKALKVYEQFNAVTKNIWSSEAVKKYIRAKSKKTYKSEIFKRFFEQNAKPMNKDLQFKIEPEQRQTLTLMDLNNNANKENINTINIEQDRTNNTPPLIAKAKPSFKEDFILLESPPKTYAKEENSLQADNFEGDGDKSDEEEFSQREDHFSESPERVRSHNQNPENSTKEDEGTMDLNLILGTAKTFSYDEEARIIHDDQDDNSIVNKSHESSKISIKDTIKSDDLTRIAKTKSLEEVKIEDDNDNNGFSGASPRYDSKALGKFNLLEDMLVTRRVITVRGLTSYNASNLRKFINYYNSKHRDHHLKLYPDTQQRYIIYKHNKYEKDNSPGIAKPQQLFPSSEAKKRGFTRFATKRYDEENNTQAQESNKSGGKHIYAHSSDENNEASDEGSKSATSLENWSNVSDSLNVNTYLLKRGSTYNMSDKFDLSDEAESITIPEGKEDTSLEFLQSGNSISEQTIEEDEDEEGDIIFNSLSSPTHPPHHHHSHPTHQNINLVT